MGCSASRETKKMIKKEKSSENLETSEEYSDKRRSIAKSHDSLLTTSDSVQSEKSTVHSGSEVLSSNRSRSVDLSRNGSAKSRSEPPPTATATIIRKASSNTTVEKGYLAQAGPSKKQDVKRMSENNGKKKNRSSQRRSSDGDIGKVTQVTCIPGSLMKTNSLLRSNHRESKLNPRAGPQNRHLTSTESQKDFFRMLDEKVAMGKDYCSEDERSLSSIPSHSISKSERLLLSSPPLEVG